MLTDTKIMFITLGVMETLHGLISIWMIVRDLRNKDNNGLIRERTLASILLLAVLAIMLIPFISDFFADLYLGSK